MCPEMDGEKATKRAPDLHLAKMHRPPVSNYYISSSRTGESRAKLEGMHLILEDFIYLRPGQKTRRAARELNGH